MNDQNDTSVPNDQQAVTGQDLGASVISPSSQDSSSPTPALDDTSLADSPASHPTAPIVDQMTSPGYIMTDPPSSTSPSTPPTSSTAPADASGLLSIKQSVLQDLSPLVGHLDQTPEEKFRTTMMMIQATDNHELIKTAYESAKAIGDEKERAQALLDIVNEINYFTTQQNS